MDAIQAQLKRAHDEAEEREAEELRKVKLAAELSEAHLAAWNKSDEGHVHQATTQAYKDMMITPAPGSTPPEKNPS